MRKLRFVLPAAILIGGLTIPATLSYGTAEYTKKEKKGCTYCHTKANSKELNKVGQCYKEKKTLVGCATQ
jgi:hypothetical protein